MFVQPAGRSNGMYFDAPGRLIACADEKNELWTIAPDGKATVLSEGRQVEHVLVPEPRKANVSFCGPDRRTLFITASKGLYSVRTRTKGGGPAK